MTREFEADFATGSVQGTSFLTRPDAIGKHLYALSFGPRSIGDTLEGLMVKGWYVRADNAAGKVYLGEAKDELRFGWNAEVELFSYSGDDIDELDFTFDQNGNAVAVAERAGDVWVYYFKPSEGTFVFENFGAGRNPRCILDDPRHPAASDILVFYVRAGEVRLRSQADLYVSEADTGHAMTDDQYIEGTLRDGILRVHLLVSERDPVLGRWSMDRVSSKLYPYYAPEEEFRVDHSSLAGGIVLVILTSTGSTEEIDVSHSSIQAGNEDVVGPVSMSDEIDFAAAIESVSILDLVIVYIASEEELGVSHMSIAGDTEMVVIDYVAPEEELDVSHTSLAGTIVVP